MKPDTIAIIAILAPIIVAAFAAFIRYVRTDGQRDQQLKTLIEGQDEIKNMVAGQATDLGLLRTKMGEVDARSQRDGARIDAMERQIGHIVQQVDRIQADRSDSH